MTSKNRQYEKDFYQWSLYTAALIRQGEFAKVDIEHVAEELESMGRSDKRELINRFALLMAHLLKWQFQPEKRSNSWKSTIKEQRLKIADLLEESPSLKHEIAPKLNHAYQQAMLIAVRETGLAETQFPKSNPFTINKCLDQKYFPK